ncbi:MAG: IS4 family transposase [Candidatus Aerophobetes bacterium]|nr:IS4 family transposase [Candidatus Aerophobetes bacterium]
MKEICEEELTELKGILEKEFPSLRKTITRNLSCLIFALILLLRTYRGWYGRLTLSGIARCFPARATGKNRYKRLSRFLDNENFQMIDLTKDLTHLISPEENLLPVVVDQTAIRDVQVISANVPIEGRSIPIAIFTFEYGKIKSSQNTLEEEFLTALSSNLPEGKVIVQIADRGYMKSTLIKNRLGREELFIIRGRKDVTITYRENGKTYRKSLGRLKHSQEKPRRYRDCFYQGRKEIKVDVIVYRGKGFKEPWFLLVPSGKEDILPTEIVVKFYRRRMRIEVTFRDFKSHLGVRGLSLKVRKRQRLDRLLGVMVLTYVLLLVLGIGEIGRLLRKRIEILRPKARHGTRKTLSVLTISLFAISDTFLLTRDNLINVLTECFTLLQREKVFMLSSFECGL